MSGTLLGKHKLFFELARVLLASGNAVSISEIKTKHRFLSEVISFPDTTDEVFYNYFNAELLRLLGVIPDKKLLREIFSACSYLPWERFEDTEVLDSINLPMAIVSNFNATLGEKIVRFFGSRFKRIIISEEVRCAKPSPKIYEIALSSIGIDPSEALYVGDSIKLDIEPATKVGIKSLLIDREQFYPASKHRISSLFEINSHLSML